MKRRARGAIAVLVVAALMTGCALSPPTPVSDSEARDRFLAELDEAQRLIGGTWEVLDDPTPRECVIPFALTGQRYPALRLGSPSAAPAAAAARVERAWTEQGMRVTRTDIGEVIEVKAETDHGELLLLRVSASASTLLGESECRPL